MCRCRFDFDYDGNDLLRIKQIRSSPHSEAHDQGLMQVHNNSKVSLLSHMRRPLGPAWISVNHLQASDVKIVKLQTSYLI